MLKTSGWMTWTSLSVLRSQSLPILKLPLALRLALLMVTLPVSFCTAKMRYRAFLVEVVPVADAGGPPSAPS